MVDIDPCGVVLQQDKCRTAHVLWRTIQSLDAGTDETGFAGSQGAVESDGQADRSRLSHRETETVGLLFAVGVVGQRCHVWPVRFRRLVHHRMEGLPMECNEALARWHVVAAGRTI